MKLMRSPLSFDGATPWRGMHCNNETNKESVMKKHILAAVLLAVSGSIALAQAPAKPDEGSLSGKAMKDQPGNNGGGSTSMPNAKPDEGSLSGKAMKDQPGNNSAGTTSTPTAKPMEDSLSGKAMKDLPGNK
jgi:hypothetical protein